MTGGGEKASADQAGPEAIVSRKERGRPGKPEIEHLKLVGRIPHLLDMRPTAWNLVQDDKKAQDRSGHVQEHLDHVGPDYGCHSSLKSVEQSEAHDGQDGHHFAGSKN